MDKELAQQLGIKRIFTTPYHPQVCIHVHVHTRFWVYPLSPYLRRIHQLFVQANGLDERYNQTPQNMLVKYVHDKKEVWDDHLDTCIYAYNTAVQESTSFTPFELMFGRKAVLPIEIDFEKREADELFHQYTTESIAANHIQVLTDQRLQNLQLARKNITRAQEKQKEMYDRKHACPGSFVMEDLVLKKI